MLFIKNRSVLLKYAFSLTKSKEEAEDIVHDSYINMYKNASSFNRGTNFNHWAKKIIKNLFIDALRKRKNIQEVEIKDYHKGVCTNAGVAIIDNSDLYKVIDSFSKENKKIVILYMQGYKREEIAKQVKWSIDKLNSRLHKLKKILKEELKEKKI
ncbi:hypothetical protein N824_20550 [Sporocytophaga myxococcoides]|uniref:RNA polymerase sigma-70 region 2 domain-containing protein n=2 Tax=Sporocytophaga myxococcoides TaxID=153721 RepID=A0A098L971_9BACT|nr:hypothetical protein N824_20550 [Sporocytophaga myxococcoides]